jgi:hypothetical protein
MAITSPPAVVEETFRNYTVVFSSGESDRVDLRAEDTVTVSDTEIVFAIANPPEQIRWFLAHVAAVRVGSHVVKRVIAEPVTGRTNRGGLERP